MRFGVASTREPKAPDAERPHSITRKRVNAPPYSRKRQQLNAEDSNQQRGVMQTQVPIRTNYFLALHLAAKRPSEKIATGSDSSWNNDKQIAAVERH